MNEPYGSPIIGIVGPCGAGKSTLMSGLKARGFSCRHIAQEHSYVKDMWQRLANPDVLIFLQASFPVSTARRHLDWLERDHTEQQHRLAHARAHADLIVDTDPLTAQQVLDHVLDFLKEYKP